MIANSLYHVTVMGNLYWLFPINFDKGGANPNSSKRRNIRIFIRYVSNIRIT